MNHKLHSYKSIFTNWLLYLTLVWSVALFSGYVYNDYFSLPSLTSTELVEPEKPVKTTISFYENIADITQQQLVPFLFLSKTALLAYHQLQQVQFIAWTKKRYLDRFLFNYLPIKTIPNDSKEIVFASSVG